MSFIFKFINKVIILFLFIGFGTAIFDYYRMQSGEIPIFNNVQYDFRENKQIFKGLFYVAERKILVSFDEALGDSSDINYKLFIFPLKVSLKKKNLEEEFKIIGQGSLECEGSSKLYFANLDTKIYTYCLEDIFIKEKENRTLLSYLEKDDSILTSISNRFGYVGIKQNMMKFYYRDDEAVSDGLVMYQCDGENMNDVYFVPKGVLPQIDFCTYKDDDFAFIFEVIDESGNIEDAQGEKAILFEDENYFYEVDKNKIDYLFAVAPEVRGRSAVKISLRGALQENILSIDDVLKKSSLIQKREKSTGNFN